MTRVFFFDENGASFFSMDAPNSPQELKGKIIARTWPPDVRLPWDRNPMSVHIHANMVFVTPQGCSDDESELPFPDFTSREREVLEAMVAGLGHKEIGQTLCISPRTVKAYISVIKKKLNAETTINAVARAVAIGVCRPKFD